MVAIHTFYKEIKPLVDECVKWLLSIQKNMTKVPLSYTWKFGEVHMIIFLKFN